MLCEFGCVVVLVVLYWSCRVVVLVVLYYEALLRCWSCCGAGRVVSSSRVVVSVVLWLRRVPGRSYVDGAGRVVVLVVCGAGRVVGCAWCDRCIVKRCRDAGRNVVLVLLYCEVLSWLLVVLWCWS